MKRIAIIVVMALMSLTVSATSIRYFTYAQASRTVQYLNAQQEMMIYCGYDYEIETYVLINEVWMERINSAYYELWVYGYDAYTGDEIYMPLDLQCVWLYSAGRMYNAAQYLRFHATVRMPSFAWFVPPYNPYSRRMHAVGYMRSYHYDIHRHGWMPPAPPYHGWGPHTHPPLPPYYMRTPQTPPPAPIHTWTPGVEHPQVHNSNNGNGPRSTGAVPTTRPTASGTATPGTSTRSGSTRATETATPSRGTETRGGATETRSNATESRTGTTTRSTGTTPTRSNSGTSRVSEESGRQEGGTETRTGSNRTGSSATSTTTTRTGNSRTTGTTTTTTTRTGSTRSNAAGTTTTSTTRSGSSRASGTSNATTGRSAATRSSNTPSRK